MPRIVRVGSKVTREGWNRPVCRILASDGDAKDFGGPTSSEDASDLATTIFTTPGASGLHLNGRIIVGTGW
jgi:hypothetical protein